MMKYERFLGCAAVWIGLIFCCSQVDGAILDKVENRHLIKNAELIFQGVVTKVEYKESNPISEDYLQLPHAFVTFRIENVLKGSAKDKEFITLRFQGGMAVDGRVLMIPGIPLFDVGDRDILFVHRNGRHICPLVGWQQGRFRIIDGALVNDAGQEVIIKEQLKNASVFNRYDILNDSALLVKLQERQTTAVQQVWNALRENTRQAITQYKAGDPVPGDLKTMLIADWNRMLSNRRQFTVENLTGIELRSETSALVNREREQLSEDEVYWLNRLVMEDVFPGMILKSMKIHVGLGTRHILDDVINNTVGDAEVKRIVSRVLEGEGNENVSPVTGIRATPDEFIKHIQNAVSFLHTEAELANLLPVESLSIQENLLVRKSREVEFKENIRFPASQILTEEDRIEAELLLQNNGNPVLKQQ